MKSLIGILIALLAWLVSPGVAAQDLILERAMLEDVAGTLTIEQVSQLEFQPVARSLSRGYTDSVHWLRLTVRAPQQGREVVLRIYPPNLDEVRLFEAGPWGWQTRVTGDRHPYVDRDQPAIALGFVVHVSEPQVTYYLRLKTTSISWLNVEALMPQAAQRLERQVDLIEDVFIALMLWTLVWAFHHWLLHRERLVGLLALSQALFILYDMALMGYLAPFMPTGHPEWADMATNVLVCAWQLPCLLFTRALFQRYAPPPALMRGFDLLMLVFPVLMLLMALGFTRIALQANYLLFIAARAYFLLVSLTLREEGMPSRRFLRTLHVVLALVVAVLIASHIGWLDDASDGLRYVLVLVVYATVNSLMLIVLVHARLKALHHEARQSSVDLALSQQALALERAHKEEARYLAYTDHLTGLANRRHFVEQAGLAIQRALHERRPLALLMIDLDHFKALNDTLGHAAGDVVLQGVARRLRDTLHRQDLVGRIGGEEFAVVLMDTDAEQAAVRSQALRRAVADTPFDFQEAAHGIHATISLGLTLLKGRPVDLGCLLKEADHALYIAKASGRDALKVHDDELGQRAQLRAQITHELASALERGELSLHYQPVFGADGRQPVCAEALLRWQHPRLGLVPPQAFVDVAEDTGLIVPIGAWVLQQACRDAMTWSAPLQVAVNLSVRQLHSRGIVDDVRQALALSGLPAHRLELEVTESALAQEAAAADALDALRELGVGLALDDFGTGFSSLAYLQRFRFDRLKIDRAFVLPLQQLENSAPVALVRAVIELARALDLACTAEGIENAGQLKVLCELGCSALQGFHLARPMADAALRDFLAGRHDPVGTPT
ncbi:diguanylate cyclase (GGDEF)-like protein [Sphaerotilus hippei]|uniref:Diguanylate cyclase (GGDEF)-like protein n=1 Tax=Sphaerotilus hippei TaxID=744406 RepID=A0A318H4K1_9BURK|nr:EAL domain-containing protein [Sphaerotilus hippei]PXW96976.1 diguanylate cyclase (GGDEF)-like protein [Sphaerotilus hippei]